MRRPETSVENGSRKRTLQEKAMHLGFAIVLCLLFGAVTAGADEPKAAAPSAARRAAKATAPKATAPLPRVPLKLAVGDVRRYMMPNDYREALGAPDADKTTIVVQGDRPAPLLQSEQPLAQGLPAYLALFTHPTNAWRMFLPDPRGIPAGPPDPVPQREFRWGP
jgi:hypothetical protein